MGFIGRSLRGEEDLWKVFWLYGLMLGYGLQFVVTEYVLPMGGNVTLAGIGFEFLYQLWLFIALWRCAFNADWSIWGYILRTLQALTVLALIIGALALTDVIKTPASAPLKGAVKAAIRLPECQAKLAEQAKAQGLDPEKYIKSNRDALVACMNAPSAATQQPITNTQ